MANYIAELISAAESAETKKEKTQANRACAEAILAVWEHRASIPHAVHPLYEMREVLRALLALSKPNPWDRHTFTNEWLNRANSVSKSSRFLIQLFLRAAISSAALEKGKGSVRNYSKLMSRQEVAVIKALGGIESVAALFDPSPLVIVRTEGSPEPKVPTPDERLKKKMSAIEKELQGIITAVRLLANGGKRSKSRARR